MIPIAGTGSKQCGNNKIGTRLLSSFVPSPPPGTFGTPVFPDIHHLDVSIDSSAAESALRNADPQAVFVVTGANRGIGDEFVKQLLQRTNGTIIGCCRSPDAAQDLQKLLESHQHRIHKVALGVENQESIEQAGRRIAELSGGRVDMLLNVAGILGDGGKTTPGPERSITKMDRNWFEKTMAVNLIGPFMLTKELIPLLKHRPVKKARPKSDIDDNNDDNETVRRPTSVIVNMSARVGSISDRYSYRMSKSALNQATRTMAHELKRQSMRCIALQPGTTNTDLSKPFQANVKEGSSFPVDFTVSQLLQIIDSIRAEHSGGFYDWAGQALSF